MSLKQTCIWIIYGNILQHSINLQRQKTDSGFSQDNYQSPSALLHQKYFLHISAPE